MEELLSLKWNNHRSTFLQILSLLRTKNLYTDVTVACEGKFYEAHRLVLSTCSDYFGAMFERTNCKNPVVVLKDIRCEDLEALLDYMYLGEVNVRQSELASLIKSAECLKVKGLAVPDDELMKRPCRNEENPFFESRSSPSAKRRRREDADKRNGAQSGQLPQPKSPSHGASSPDSLYPVDDLSHHSSPQRAKDSNAPDGPCGSVDEHTPSGLAPFVKVELEDGDEGSGFGLPNDACKVEKDPIGDDDLSNDLKDFLPPATSSGMTLPFSLVGTAFQHDWPNDPLLSGAFGNISFSSLTGSCQDSPQGVPHGSKSSPQRGRAQGEGVDKGARAPPLDFLLLPSTSFDKKHRCHICPKVFLYAWELKRHLAAHEDARPYRCSYCSHRSNFKHNIKTHIIAVHRGKPFSYHLDVAKPVAR